MKALLCRGTLLTLILVPKVFASACPIATLNVYLTAGFTCLINDEPVANFTFSPSGYLPVSASQINVTPTFTGSSYTLTFASSGFNLTTSGESVGYQINFTWDDPVVVRAEDGLDSDPPTSPGVASVTTNLCAGGLFGVTCSAPTNTLFVMNNGLTSIPVADTSFPPSAVVDTQSLLTLSTLAGGTSEITSFSETVFTPEPGALALATSGFFGLLLVALARPRARLHPTL
jgi:hypothetical protein